MKRIVVVGILEYWLMKLVPTTMSRQVLAGNIFMTIFLNSIQHTKCKNGMV